MSPPRRSRTGPAKKKGFRRRSDRTSAGWTGTVVYIHGIGKKDPPAILKVQWDRALFGRNMGDRTRMAYWADLLHPLPEGAERTSSSAPGAWGPKSEAYARSLARRIRDGEERRLRAQRVEAKLLPGFLRRPVTEWITKTLIEDTAAYFYERTLREAMRERLRRVLLSARPPFLLVAHSQGTIIAYDVLHELAAQGVRVAHLFTLGSPLGLEEIQDHIHRPLAIPKACEGWWNFWDLLDPVAADKGLANDFSPKRRIRDERVVNRDSLRIRGFNPHSATGYLGTSDVRRRAREILGPAAAQPLARAVIASDLAAAMAEPAERLPVLIELDEKARGKTLAEKRDLLERALRKLTGAAEDAEIDPLRRYVAARLSSEEVETLAARHGDLNVHRIWRDSAKRALVTTSARTIQVETARLGYGATGRGIHWAVLDTGIARDHPHFARHRNLQAEWDCTRPGKPVRGRAVDEDGHGTHVAGILAGEGKAGGKRLAGMAPETGLHVYRVLGDDGTGNDSWIIKALDHIGAVNEESPSLAIHGVNLSLGGPFDAETFACGHSPICKELRRLWRQGVVVCIAAGNEGVVTVSTAGGEQDLVLDLSIGDPANLEESIAVGSVHKERPHRYGISFFSSRGPTSDGRAKPDLVAPGERILSANSRYRPGGREPAYVERSGTSMASPHVSGLIAAFLSVRPEFVGYPDEVKRLLLAHCTDLRRDRYHQGAGMPNLVRMMTAT